MKYFIIIPLLILGAYAAYLYLKPSPLPSAAVIDPSLGLPQEDIVLPVRCGDHDCKG